MSSHNVLVVGTGAIGAFFASRLASISSVKVSTICRSNYKQVSEHGIRVTSPIFKDTTFKPEQVFASSQEARDFKNEHKLVWDYFFVSTKVLPELGDTSALLDGLVDDGPEARIVVCQNGLGIEEPYRKRFPRSTIISAVTRTSVQSAAPNHIKHYHWTNTTIGPYAPGADSTTVEQAGKQVEEFAALLRAAEIPDVDVLDHTGMQFARWHKTAINAAANPTAVLAGGTTNQQLGTNEELSTHARGVMREVLGAAEKVLGEAVPQWLPTVSDVFDGVKGDVSGSKASMLLDWEAQRPVELEVILGEPLRQARSVGFDMPRVQSMYAMLKLAQELRDSRGKKI